MVTKKAIVHSEQIRNNRTKASLYNLMFKQKPSMFPFLDVSLQFSFRITINGGNVHINTQKGNKTPNDQHPLIQILKRNSLYNT